MIGTAEIQDLQKYADKAPSPPPDNFPSNHSENEAGKNPISRTYKESSDRERTKKRSLQTREVILGEMEETGELLDKDHELYKVVDKISYRLKPEAKPDINLSLSDSGQAFTLRDGRTIVLSAGIFIQLEQYLKTKGKELSEDHIALIIGHEMSHWDEQAKNPHISERYCDTQGLMLVNRAGFDIDSAVEALEFLEFAEEKAKRESGLGDEGGVTVNTGEMSHPTSEDRRILVQSIANDPNAYLEGRYAIPTKFSLDTYGDFKQKSEQWLKQARARQMISSEEGIEQEFNKSKSLSQILETFVSADEYFHANMSREFSQTQEFGNLTLAMAVYGEITNNDFTLLNKEDFQAQFRAGLLPKEAVLKDASPLPTQPNSAPFSPTSSLTAEQLQLIRDCLDGKFQNPLDILTSTKSDLETNYPQLAGFTFNNFFRGIAGNINQFIQPEVGSRGVKAAQNLDRAKILAFEEKLNIDGYLSDEVSGTTTQISQERSILLDKTKYALSSSLLRLSQIDRSDVFGKGIYDIAIDWDSREWSDFVITSSELVKDIADSGPDYKRLQSQIAQSLLSSEACATQEVANRISLMILSCGRYLEEQHTSKAPKTLWRSGPDLGSFWTDTPETHQDLKNSLYKAHLSLTQGGEELGRVFGRPRVGRFIERLNHSAYELAGNQAKLIGDSLDPYQMLIDGDPTISIPFQDRILDGLDKAAGPKIDFVTIMMDKNWWSTTETHRLVCETSDPEIIRRLILQSATDTGSGAGRERRSMIIQSVLNNDQVRANTSLLRSILQEGVENKLLTSKEVHQILEGANDLPLYTDFRQYLDESIAGDYYKRSFEQLRQTLEAQGIRLPEIIAKFVESGEVIDSTGMLNQNYGARIIPDSEFGNGWYSNTGQPYPEHANFSFSDATHLASRIIAYTNTPDFPHSGEVKQILLNNAASLIRYSEKLSDRLGYIAHEVSRLEYIGENMTSLDDFTQRVSKMPASGYRDRCIESVALMVLNPNSEFRTNNSVSLDQVKTLFKMYSPKRLRELDPESESGSLFPGKPLTTLPLEQGSFDLREMYPFRYQSNDRFLDGLEQLAGMLDTELGTENIQELASRLGQATDAIPHPSSIRDYLIERALFPLLRGDEQFAGVTIPEKLSILQTAYEAAHTIRTKGALGKQIAEIRLDQISANLNFEDGLRVILESMPTRSTSRDQLILKVLNTTYTDWTQINRAEALLLGNDYQTDEVASATRSIVNEAIFRKLEDMSTEERDELVFFLLDPTKHVLRPENLTEEFFDDKVQAKLKKHIVGVYQRSFPSNDSYGYNAVYKKVTVGDNIPNSQEFNESNYNQISSSVSTYLLRRFKGEDTSQLRTDMYTALGSEADQCLAIIDQLELPEILQLAIPDSLSEFIQQQLGGGRKISATSLGPMFVAYNPEDRRQLLYRLCLGSNGFFENKNFNQHGSRILESFIDLSTRQSIPAVAAEQVNQQWNTQEIDTTKKVLTTIFSTLDSGRRAEVFSRIINLIIDSGGTVSKEQLIKTALTAFGVVGAKVGQMDQLMPEYLRDELGSLKEQVPPIPKTTVAQVLRRSGRDHYYEGLGSAIGAASTATVYLARRQGESEEDRVIKVLRPDALKHVDSDLNAVQSVVTTLRESGTLSVDPTQIIEELKTMIAEEFNPQNEQRNVEDIEQGRKPTLKKRALEILRIKPQEASTSKVSVPKVDFAGEAHLEMSRALGVSLAKIEEIKAKANRNEALTEEEDKYVQLDLKVIHEAVVSDFFEQAFTTGTFHTDLHQGNIFIDSNGDITEIDHGQVGREKLSSRRRALVELSIGLARNEPRLVAKAISEFAPRMSSETVQTALVAQSATSNNNLLAATTRFISDNNIQGSVNRFTKAMVNIYPYMRDIDESTFRKIMLPYLTDAAVIFDLERAVPGMVTEPIKEAVSAKLAPVVDEISRLDRVRRDPAAREVLSAVMKTSAGIATIGADLAYLLGKGDTIMGMPIPHSLRSISEIAGLLSGRKQGKEITEHALTAGTNTAENIAQLREALSKLQEKYRAEKADYQTNRIEMDEAMQNFGVEPSRSQNG